MGCEKCDVKPCPFCGSGAFFVPEDNEVTCGNCNANNAPEDWDQRVATISNEEAKKHDVTQNGPVMDDEWRCKVCGQTFEEGPCPAEALRAEIIEAAEAAFDQIEYAIKQANRLGLPAPELLRVVEAVKALASLTKEEP